MEDPEIKSILLEQLELARENNKILKKIRSVQKWNSISKLFYWILILGVSFGAYIYVQKYIQNLLGAYSGTSSSFMVDVNNIQKLLNAQN